MQQGVTAGVCSRGLQQGAAGGVAAGCCSRVLQQGVAAGSCSRGVQQGLPGRQPSQPAWTAEAVLFPGLHHGIAQQPTPATHLHTPHRSRVRQHSMSDLSRTHGRVWAEQAEGLGTAVGIAPGQLQGLGTAVTTPPGLLGEFGQGGQHRLGRAANSIWPARTAGFPFLAKASNRLQAVQQDLVSL